jgi:tetratricopeptide (TPR) repeat protein
MAEKIEQLLLRARQAIAQRDWGKAKQYYLLALGQKSDLPDIHYGLATVYFQLRELTSAAHHFREVTRLDSQRAGAYVNLGAVLNVLHELDEAIHVLRKAIKLDPKRVEAYYNLALVHRRKGQRDMAIQAYREAIRLNPRMSDAHLNLANLFLEKEQHRQAINHYDQALAIRPGWSKALEGKAHAEALEKGIKDSTPNKVVGETTLTANRENLDRMTDPVVHGLLLHHLHATTISTEEAGQLCRQILEKEIEPAIKELSNCLLYPERRGAELGACVEHFETAMTRFREVQASLDTNLGRLRGMSERFPNP